jgi:hypothetical protein
MGKPNYYNDFARQNVYNLKRSSNLGVGDILPGKPVCLRQESSSMVFDAWSNGGDAEEFYEGQLLGLIYSDERILPDPILADGNDTYPIITEGKCRIPASTVVGTPVAGDMLYLDSGSSPYFDTDELEKKSRAVAMVLQDETLILDVVNPTMLLIYLFPTNFKGNTLAYSIVTNKSTIAFAVEPGELLLNDPSADSTATLATQNPVQGAANEKIIIGSRIGIKKTDDGNIIDVEHDGVTLSGAHGAPLAYKGDFRDYVWVGEDNGGWQLLGSNSVLVNQSVHVHPDGGANFTSVADAMTNITDSATGKRYTIFVHPGTYVQSATLTLKPYISIIGVGAPESVVLSRVLGAVLTGSTTNSEVSIENVTIESAPTDSTSVLVALVQAALNTSKIRFKNVIFKITSSTNDITGKIVDLTEGNLEFVDCRFVYDMDGTLDASVRTHDIFDLDGTGDIKFDRCSISIDVADEDDIVNCFTSATAGNFNSFQLSNTSIALNLSHASYDGTVTVFNLDDANIDKQIVNNIVRLTSGSSAGTGNIFSVDTTAGADVIESSHNQYFVSGFASNYFVNIATGDTLNSVFDYIKAADGIIGAGTVKYSSAMAAGDFSVSQKIEVHGNGEIRFYDDGNNYVGFEAPALTADQIWVLPAVDGSDNDSLKTDGAGNLNFEA